MKAEITCYVRDRRLGQPPVESFEYRLYGNNGLFHEDSITLRTARVFAAELEGSSAFMMMVQAIAASSPSQYRFLAGSIFSD
jgi:hypothetical protein